MEWNIGTLTLTAIVFYDIICGSVASMQDSNVTSTLMTASMPSSMYVTSASSEESTISGTEQINALSSIDSNTMIPTTDETQQQTAINEMYVTTEKVTSNETSITTEKQDNKDRPLIPIPFNCLRPRATCAGDGSTCSPESATCQCAEGRQGFDCSLLTKSVVAACDPPCLNGGTCYSKPLNDTTNAYHCYCTEAYYGDSCANERVSHKCNPDSMEISVAPIVSFGDVFVGSVYVKGHEDDPKCVFTAEANDPSTLVNTIHFTDCGKADNNTDMATGMTSLSWRMIVRYDDVLLETDQELTLTCYLRQPGNTYEWHAWMISHDNMVDSHLPSRSVSSDVQPVLMSLETLDGKPVIGPQQLGTSLQLKYTLNGGNVYDSFRIEKLAVSNAMTGPKRHVFSLVADSCVTEDASRVKKVVQSLERRSASEIFLRFKVFKLRYSNQLIFENVIKACRSNADCQPIECKQATISRRKRSINETADLRPTTHNGTFIDSVQATVYKKANATLTVWDLGDEHGEIETDTDCSKLSNSSSRQGHNVDNQLRNIVFIVVAVALIVAIVIVVSLVVSVVCFRVLRKH